MISTQNSLDIEVRQELDNIKDEFVNSKEFLEYKNLEKLVYEKYLKEIVSFNNAKEALEEAKKYHIDLKQKEEVLSRAKKELYSKEEVKRLKELEKILQNELDQISNSIASHFSNKLRQDIVDKASEFLNGKH